MADRRRSNVVKEIDRLAKNREQRRAKQQEVLEEKSAKQNVDPGNPNWEFLFYSCNSRINLSPF